jgi:hypothetical protein
VVLFVIYRIWVFNSYEAWAIGWTTQSILMTLRALAVAEICRHLFQSYRGIWELIRRVLLVSAAIVLLYGVIVARHNRFLIMPNIQRGLDLAIATGLVGLFLFARYYQIAPSPVLGKLALGFLLYSGFGVLNATLLERSRITYGPLWNILQMVSFLASVFIWTGAFWQTQTADAGTPVLSSSDLYRALTPQVNVKLRLLNERLSRFWKVEAK